MKDKLDFIIVGSQKCGTTSLTAYLQPHPDIYIPPEKELPYFASPEMMKYGWSLYLETFFKDALPTQFWGTSSPQYMLYPESFSKIKNQLPNVKIIVIIRDPIQRMLSHFDMMTRFGVEKRPLNVMLEEQLLDLDYCRNAPYHPDHLHKYIRGGEYGRIINKIYENFGKSQVMIILLNELIKNRESVIFKMLDFLGVNRHNFGNLETVKMKGGSKRKVPINHSLILGNISKTVRFLGLSKFIPSDVKRWYEVFSSFLDQINVGDSVRSLVGEINPNTLNRLKSHYFEDSKLLLQKNIRFDWDYEH
jgi:hypothetical protein